MALETLTNLLGVLGTIQQLKAAQAAQMAQERTQQFQARRQAFTDLANLPMQARSEYIASMRPVIGNQAADALTRARGSIPESPELTMAGLASQSASNLPSFQAQDYGLGLLERLATGRTPGDVAKEAPFLNPDFAQNAAAIGTGQALSAGQLQQAQQFGQQFGLAQRQFDESIRQFGLNFGQQQLTGNRNFVLGTAGIAAQNAATKAQFEARMADARASMGMTPAQQQASLNEIQQIMQTLQGGRVDPAMKTVLYAALNKHFQIVGMPELTIKDAKDGPAALSIIGRMLDAFRTGAPANPPASSWTPPGQMPPVGLPNQFPGFPFGGYTP